MPSESSFSTTVKGGSMFARVSGAGCDVVLVHGVGVSGRYMRPLLPRLGAMAKVWLPDLPGFGRSWKPRRALDVVGLSEALIGWMDAVGIDRAVLIGNSMGCQTAAAAAVQHPSRVRGLVLTSPTMDASARVRSRQLYRFTMTALREPFSLYPIVIGDFFRAGLWRTWRTFDHALADRLEDRLTAVTVPTLVVRGARDRMVPQPWAKQLARAAPCGRLFVVPRGAHAVPFDAPDDLMRGLSVFLRADCA